MNDVNTPLPEGKLKISKKGVTIQRAVHISMRWISLIILGALALEGAKYLVKGGETIRELLAAAVIVLLFYAHLT